MSYLKKKIFQLDLLTIFLVTALCIFCFLLGGKFYNETTIGTKVLVGIGMGVFASLVLAIRDKLSNEQKSYLKGDEGEKFLGDKLKRELPGVLLCLDVKLAYGNADFVLICDHGAYCIENKNIAGKITFDQSRKVLLKNSRPFSKDYLKQVKGASLKLKNIIKDNLKIDIYVQPILVFSKQGVSLDIPAKVENVHVQTPSELVDFIKQNKQQELSKKSQIRICDFLKKTRN